MMRISIETENPSPSRETITIKIDYNPTVDTETGRAALISAVADSVRKLNVYELALEDKDD